MKKHHTITRIALIASIFLINSSHADPNNIINGLRAKIYQNFINIPSYNVVQKRAFFHRPISSEFEDFLANVDNAQLIQKIIEIAKDGTGGFSLDAVQMRKNVEGDFYAKRVELVDNIGSYKQGKLVTIEMFLISCIATAGTIIYTSLKKDKHKIFAGIGCCSIVGNAIGCYYSNTQIKLANEHLDENFTMIRRWDDAFKKLQPKSEKN